jgi:hypothetical protein
MLCAVRKFICEFCLISYHVFLGIFGVILTKKLALTSQLSRKVERGMLILSKASAVPQPGRP